MIKMVNRIHHKGKSTFVFLASVIKCYKLGELYNSIMSCFYSSPV